MAGEGLFGDMPAEEFEEYGRRVVAWAADYLAHPERYPVLARTRPGAIKAALPAEPPRRGEPMDRILADFEQVLLPGITHWNHPAFFAYFAITGSAPGILGELLAAALNVNAMLWKTSPAATELEEVALNWLRQMVGLPEGFMGIIMDTASVASLCAIAAAREAVAEHRFREEGMAGGPRLRLYTSEQAHSSIEKAGIVLGLGRSGVRKIPTDSAFRMDVAALRRAVAEDRDAGWRPFCVAATVGTTSTTSVDPVPAIAEVCRQEGLWLHVDGAYAGMAAIAPEFRWALDGCDHADSVVINPHKWLFTPIDCSAFYCRRPEVLRAAFSLVPEYLRTAEAEAAGVRDFMDYGIQLGRRFRALKLWMVIRYFGWEGLAARIREHVRLGQLLASWIDGDPEFERLAPTPFSTVCFRARPRGVPPDRLDEVNAALLDAVNATGDAFLSHTRLRGAFTLRFAIGHIRTGESHVRAAWNLLRRELRRLTEPR
ncbi:MAG: pyridoxal-dependent decarboxylase [Armatimonadota bacterium]|nr:pyridoxal-dependent decarboxylase [Armatimonadota bacterium]MDR7451092.1 pyridoxal-dependent decarboxylase [Armatimonadota bacterium]MDR7465887.1 pyridoxal-dependent decarboxylase [Armatimonadota bacterium]MDR7493952.1 pyridoxal-dependent decarboxylase [Armatimonadota bacterium]MDR7498402.1 pyridoxal-dependent decarboxylase [Armatimonadota bacterium]